MGTHGDDVYPDALWAEFGAYCENAEALENVAMREAFGGARYGFAAALQMRGFPFLNGRSLGELCHIVQLALTERRLLGYRDGRIVPYDRSQTRLKEFSAKLQRPCTKVVSQGTRGSMPVATWDMARSLLRDLLVANDGQMKLPN